MPFWKEEATGSRQSFVSVVTPVRYIVLRFSSAGLVRAAVDASEVTSQLTVRVPLVGVPPACFFSLPQATSSSAIAINAANRAIGHRGYPSAQPALDLRELEAVDLDDLAPRRLSCADP